MKEYLNLFVSFFKIGLFTIGGGLAMIPMFQREFVEKKKWMKDEEMVDCLAVAQGLPGVVAVNVATYIGNFRKGMAGALVATVGVILPSLVIILAIASFLNQVDSPYITGALIGIKGAAAGLIGYSAITMGKKVLKDYLMWAVCIVSFLLVFLLNVSAVWVILAALILGIILKEVRK
ncbi:MAG: chromate transporter [Clostridia bacterium]|nr:chromate transporter [Clostridia bacterium]